MNVPEASVAIILSGSGSTREHVQRLGRVLCKREGKQAIPYEVITAGAQWKKASAAGGGNMMRISEKG